MAESTTRELVHRLEPSASAAPRMYQARVAALAALGFGYIILMLLAGLAALVRAVYLGAARPALSAACAGHGRARFRLLHPHAAARRRGAGRGRLPAGAQRREDGQQH